jgi:hypothetical protein
MGQRDDLSSPEAEELRALARNQDEREFREVFLALAEAYELLASQQHKQRQPGRKEPEEGRLASR